MKYQYNMGNVTLKKKRPQSWLWLVNQMQDACRSALSTCRLGLAHNCRLADRSHHQECRRHPSLWRGSGDCLRPPHVTRPTAVAESSRRTRAAADPRMATGAVFARSLWLSVWLFEKWGIKRWLGPVMRCRWLLCYGRTTLWRVTSLHDTN